MIQGSVEMTLVRPARLPPCVTDMLPPVDSALILLARTEDIARDEEGDPAMTIIVLRGDVQHDPALLAAAVLADIDERYGER